MLDLDKIAEINLPAPHALIYTDWTVIEPHFEPAQLRARETVFTIGNGYLGTRGSFEEGYPKALPTTLISGLYDDIPLVYTELANCPDWLSMVVTIDGERFGLDSGEILQYERQLDLRHGVLRRSLRWRSPIGNTVDIKFERFASLADQQVLASICHVTPVDFSGKIEVNSSINDYPDNQGFDHWEHLDRGDTEHGVWLQVRTRSTEIELSMAAKMTAIGIAASSQINSPDRPSIRFTFLARQGDTITVEKLVAVFTSQEVKQPVQSAQAKLADLPSYGVLLAAHQQAWDKVWAQSDIEIEGDLKAQLAVRYSMFQLFIGACAEDAPVADPASPNNIPDSIAAKTLSGLGYRGHIFWDTEIFILPFFTLTQPTIARSLLSYRHDTLAGARRKAFHSGYNGAMFAWESAATGDEMTPKWSIQSDPYAEPVRIWCRDREIHISADIAYAVWQYWQATGDDIWMRDCGAEVVIDTAIFWLSRVEWNDRQKRYELCNAIGADEYHEQVNNNAFTNRMVQWHLEKAIAVYEWLQHKFPDRAIALAQELKLTPERLASLHTTMSQIYIPSTANPELIEQFDGFFQLKDINLSDYEPRTRSIQAILGMEETNHTQVLKQPDVLMLLYLMRDTPEFSFDSLQKNWNYYAPRTDIIYGSSLGASVHSILAANLGEDNAYKYFMQAALIDLQDTFGNTADGIHAASAGGVWQSVVFGFGGIQLKDDGPVAKPHLPANWTRLKFKLHWRGTWHNFDLTPDARAPEIKGFIFDLDGVLTDTAEWHYRAWQRLADEEGLPFDRNANEALRGVSRKESLLLIVGKKHYSESALQEMMERKNRYYLASLQSITPKDLLPGSVELLTKIRKAGLKIAIGSASKNARTVIEKLGLADRVDAIADGDSVAPPKPAPDLFLYAAAQLGLTPAHCVVVEDAAVGIEAAIAAGMRTIGLGPVERFGGSAHLVLPNLMGVHLSDLQTQLGKSLAEL
ncbi:maltose phosphorylase / Trehalose phosphorylase [Pseudanabaena sp. lw0831]|uniref:beta-phosphoglucomutase n=1 Tax=Pseudanabaena sp. lw0831 TaxID=1357935 RepID=UPI0019153A53|nr:beta-phosphoglucomutase [Pseudanabaena sp. lw0831]GBO51856.1 maltose phosphorylase / Trehalose phosphorylase [Pseudanabaena sp. lw0831]